MPGPIVHLIVQQRLAAALRKAHGGKRYADILTGEPCSPYAAFGSMGPDYLFFSLKEYGTPLDDIVNFIFGVYDAFQPLIDFYEQNIEPVVEDIEDAIAAADQALFQGLFAQIKQTSDQISAAALSAAAVVVTGNVDLFYPFYPKIQQGAPENEWYWFDFLHYRRTGAFASRMMARAGSDAELQRYVLGYTSHIATDVVGHPYVNQLVGGPYRTHWHRHKLIENWIDAYARNRYPDSAQTIDCLGLGDDDNYLPTSISGSYYSRLVEFPNAKLPAKLSKLIVASMADVYGGIPHPVTMSAADVDASYRLWLKWFERTTSVGDALKPVPVPPPGSAATALINSYTSGFPTFPGGGGGGGGGFSILGILAAIFGFVKWIADVLAYTTSWIISNAWNIITLPYVEAIALIKWLLYQVQKAIYEIYDNLRFMLVLGGYLFPEPRDLLKSPYAAAFLTTSHVQDTGGGISVFSNYPLRQEVHGLFGTTEHHLIYPVTSRENPFAEPAPYPFRAKFPEAFISDGYAYAPIIEALYDCTGSYGAGNAFSHDVDRRTWRGGQFGNAIEFSARLIAQRMRKLPNFNLDGDRGYGWKTWRTNVPLQTTDPVSVTYIDS